MLRVVTLAGALAGGMSFAQFPAFSQQYVQRLGGAVDELSRIVTRFDATAQTAGLSRDEALAELAGSAFLQEQRRAMRADIARHARLQSHLTALQSASAVQRIVMPHRFSDPALLSATWRSFEPGVQLTVPAALVSAIGFGAGGLSFHLAGRALRRRERPKKPAPE